MPTIGSAADPLPGAHRRDPVSRAHGAPVSRTRGGSGFFVVLEGAEGAGKTTQARLLVEWLEAEGVPCRLAREPGGTPVGEAIREVLLDRGELEMPPETELLLILAARAAYVRDVVRPALEEGVVMISDRFQLSTFAYQGVARGLGVERTRRLNAFATRGLAPDLTLVFDVPAREGRARQERDGKVRDRIEGEGEEFLARVADAYRTLGAREPGAVVVDASPPAEEVHHRVRELVAARLPELSGSGRGSE
jgi:dTMP kinase